VPDIKIEWDGKKNVSNKRKHGVSFEDASARKANQSERNQYIDRWKK